MFESDVFVWMWHLLYQPHRQNTFLKFVRFFWNEKRYQCGTERWRGYHERRWRFLTARWRNIPWFRRETWGYSQSEEPLMYSRFQERRSNSWSSSSRSWTPFSTNLRKNETKDCENLTCRFMFIFWPWLYSWQVM